MVKKENVEGLISKIKYGQRLVSKEGDVWRWDGLVVTAGAPGSAAERLAQRNRLIMIHQEIDDFIKKCGTQEEIRKKIQEHQNNLSNLKLKVERIGLNKKNISEVKERRKVASEQIQILKARIIKFEEENENLSNEPKDIDDKKISIEIDFPKAYFLAKLTYPTAFVIDKDQVELNPRNWTRKPNGTGPYKLSEWKLGESIILEANTRYHLGVGDVQVVDYQLSGGSILTRFENGEVDSAGISQNDIDRVRDPSEPLNKLYRQSNYFQTNYIGMNNAIKTVR